LKLQYHTAASITLSGILYLMFKSWSLSMACCLSGIFIDIDHFIDYFRENGWSLNIKDFFRICNECQFDRIVLIWHGWEWIVLFGISSVLTDWNPWITGMFLGISHHMLMDAVANSSNFKTYSLLWRWKKDFHFDTIFFDQKPHKRKYRTSRTEAAESK
jgi:hypothetical protein